MSVVIIEDEQRIRELVARVLAGQGYVGESMGAAMNVLHAVVVCKPELVLLDMVRPDPGGKIQRRGHPADAGKVGLHQEGAVIAQGFRLKIAFDKLPEPGSAIIVGSAPLRLRAPEHSKSHLYECSNSSISSIGKSLALAVIRVAS